MESSRLFSVDTSLDAIHNTEPAPEMLEPLTESLSRLIIKQHRLRKAIGANNHDILTQFLIESILMSVAGGLGGIALGAGAALLITLIAGWSVKVSIFSIVLATGFSVMVGILFGLWPAMQASRLDPIEALRYE